MTKDLKTKITPVTYRSNFLGEGRLMCLVDYFKGVILFPFGPKPFDGRINLIQLYLFRA